MTSDKKGSPRAAFSFLDNTVRASAPLPGLAASAASRLPRWALIGLLVLYVGHGLFDRVAWRGDDLMTIALARSTVQELLSGNLAVLILPQLQELAWNQQGPLWILIVSIFLLPLVAWAAIQGLPFPINLLDDVARIPVGITLVLGFVAIWKAADRYARRREARPLDPLGVGPKSRDFGGTLGDCALLLAIATLGVIYPWHQAGPAAIGFLFQGLLLWSLATAPETPKRAAQQIPWVIAGGLLSLGPGLAIAWLIALVIVFSWVQPYRLVASEFAKRFVPLLLLLIGLWLMLCLATHPFARVGAWWVQNLDDWAINRFLADPGAGASIARWFNESLWKWWPLWPIAAFGIWKNRHVQWSRAPHWAVPIVIVSTLTVLGLIGPSDWRFHQLISVAPLALLAAFGLLSLPRPLVNLVDWFAVALFTALGIFIWLYWTALNFGFPSALAQRVAILAPGVQGKANLYEVLTGVFASMAWVVLVIWRLRRGNPRLWRPVVLSAGGLTLLWVLLMTLWLPAIDRIQGQQTLAKSLESAWIQSAQTKPKALQANTSRFCVQLTHESQTLDAIAIALTHLPVRRDPQCHWRLGSRAPNATELREWKTIWRSSGAEDRRIRERFVLLERQSP
ncbi:MAG: hypothetical protein RL132_724 [Pseudomonadota bacterium]